ncbi:MAG: LptF/LptG family permease [Nitrospirae bacterium]|nr:LptF/LptG family permease [Nitrospirota bacterium]
MKILSKYFLKEFLKFFFIILFVVITILLIAEFFDKTDEFYAKKPPVYIIVQYLLLHIPRFIILASPAASLLATLLTIGVASKWRETVVIRASGGSIKRIFSFFLITGAFISLSVLLIGETIAPNAMSKALWIKNTKILKRQPKIAYREGALWLKGLDGSLIRIKDFITDENTVLGVSIFNFDPSFELIQRIEADSAEWSDNKWVLKAVTVFDFGSGVMTKNASIISGAIEEPKIFKDEMKKPEEMNFLELYTYSRRLEKAGFKNLRYIVELSGKLSYPMVNFIMVLFGVALSLNSKLGGGIKAAGAGLGVSLLYWLIYSVSISFGNTGFIPPWFASWLSPLAFGVAGGYMYLRAHE